MSGSASADDSVYGDAICCRDAANVWVGSIATAATIAVMSSGRIERILVLLRAARGATTKPRGLVHPSEWQSRGNMNARRRKFSRGGRGARIVALHVATA